MTRIIYWINVCFPPKFTIFFARVCLSFGKRKQVDPLKVALSLTFCLTKRRYRGTKNRTFSKVGSKLVYLMNYLTFFLFRKLFCKQVAPLDAAGGK